MSGTQLERLLVRMRKAIAAAARLHKAAKRWRKEAVLAGLLIPVKVKIDEYTVPTHSRTYYRRVR